MKCRDIVKRCWVYDVKCRDIGKRCCVYDGKCRDIGKRCWLNKELHWQQLSWWPRAFFIPLRSSRFMLEWKACRCVFINCQPRQQLRTLSSLVAIGMTGWSNRFNDVVYQPELFDQRWLSNACTVTTWTLAPPGRWSSEYVGVLGGHNAFFLRPPPSFGMSLNGFVLSSLSFLRASSSNECFFMTII